MGMLRIELSETARERLEEAFKAASDRRMRDRYQAVLMAARGRARGQIAQDLGTDPRTVRRWLKAYAEGGVQGLQIQWAPGRERKIPEELAAQIVEWVKAGPAGCGLDRANWTYEELAQHLFQTHGIKVSEWAMRQLCRRHGIRPYRPTYQYLRGDAQKQEKAKEELEELKKGP